MKINLILDSTGKNCSLSIDWSLVTMSILDYAFKKNCKWSVWSSASYLKGLLILETPSYPNVQTIYVDRGVNKNGGKGTVRGNHVHFWIKAKQQQMKRGKKDCI